jgi:redox-sensitive bicupin YhaK (pirin superfamily)
MGFRALRVINEDWVKPGRGFGAHPHEDMEIVTYVLDGELEHRDSLGSGGTIRPGELQRMTAGTGIVHSEANPSRTEPVHLYQIWIFPEREGLEPSYDQRAFPEEERRNRLRVVASPDGRDGSLTIRQDTALMLGTLDAGREVSQAVAPGRHAWLQVLRGGVQLNGRRLSEGDGAAVSEESKLSIRAEGPAEVLLFDLA